MYAFQQETLKGSNQKFHTTMFQSYQPFQGVVRQLVFINVFLFIVTNLPVVEEMLPYGRDTLACGPLGTPYFQPYQVLTHMFMHGNLPHLLFNMLGLWMFGSIVEMVWGPQRFLIYYLTCGLGALAAHLLIQYWGFISPPAFVLGASGAVYGVLVAFAWHFPERKISLLFPPVTLRAPYMVALMIGVDLFSGISGYSNGIANFAHIGGAATGLLMLLYWSRGRFR